MSDGDKYRVTCEGQIGEIYATPYGDTLAREIEYAVGWLQSSQNVRVKVAYVRISHSAFAWRRED